MTLLLPLVEEVASRQMTYQVSFLAASELSIGLHLCGAQN